MWFRRKPANRRLGRDYVLDVKLRSSKVRAARTRLGIIIFSVIISIFAGGYLFWRAARWTLDRLVYQNPEFAIEQIDVQTEGVIATEQLRRWAGVRPGMNLLALDLARVKRDLEMVPLIESVSVERVLPRTLRLRVTEREPIAQVNLAHPDASGATGSAIFLLDADGWVVLPLAPGERAQGAPAPEPLPLISGVDPRVLQPGRKLDSPQITAALRLVLSFADSPIARLVDLKSIDVSSPQVLVVITGQGSEITLGLTDLPRQLARWQEILEYGRQQGKVVASVDLAIANNIPVRWLDASAVPPDNFKPPKRPRLHKAHV